MNRYATAALIGVVVEALIWICLATAITRRSTTVTTWLMHETKIGKYLYPLRAAAAVAIIGASVAITGVASAVHYL